MEKFILLLSLLPVVAQVSAQDVTAHFANTEDRFLEVGSTAQISCIVNQRTIFFFENQLNIYRTSPNGDKTLLTDRGRPSLSASPEFYKQVVNESAAETTFIITFLSIREEDDGTYTCECIDNPGKPEEIVITSNLEIYVIRPLDKVRLSFGAEPEITEGTTDPVQVDAGTYQVKCTAEGSNPGTDDVHLHLHGQKISHSAPVVEQMEGDLRRFMTTIRGTVNLDHSVSNQVLDCTARSKAGDSHTVDFPIQINIYEPEIICNDTEAYLDQRYPILTCTVYHKGLDIESFKYEIGKTGEIIDSGSQNDEFAEVKSQVIKEKEVTRVTLDLYQAKDWHFDTDFYLLAYHKGGHVSKATVKLVKVDQKRNKAGAVFSTVASLILSLVTILLLQL